MSWRDRETGHIVLKEADFSRLGNLPAGVGFRVYSRPFKKRSVWLVGTGTGSRSKKWDPGDHPFAEEAPTGGRAYVARVQELAAPFCKAIDAIVAYSRKLPKSQWPMDPFTGKPRQPYAGRSSRQIGELSLGQQIATLLGVPVLSFISDADADDELACVNEPGKVRRVYCQRAGLVLEFADGVVSVSPECPDYLAKIRGVRIAVKRRKYSDEMHGPVIREIDAFAGKGFADPDQVLPGVDELVLVGERTRNGGYCEVERA
jgi:hypothetical protein